MACHFLHAGSPLRKLSTGTVDMGDATGTPYGRAFDVKTTWQPEKREHDHISSLEQEVIDVFNQLYAKAWHGDQAIILNLNRPLNELGNKEIGLMTYEHFKKGTKNKMVTVGNPGKLVEVSDLWLTDSRARAYRDVQFYPYALGAVDPCEANNIFNMWVGWKYQPRIGECKQYIYLMQHILCAGCEIEFDYLLKWTASTIQNPSEKLRISPAFIGAQGTGKGVFMSHLGALHGKHFKHIINEDQIIGRFNLHLRDATLIFLDEACVSSVRAADKIKGLITETSIMLEGKGLQCIEGRSYSNMCFASNHKESALRIENGDRRFVLFDPSPIMKNNAAFWDSCEQEMMEGGGREALLHLLMNVNLQGFNARVKPDSARMRVQTFDMAAVAMPAVDKWLFHTLNVGSFPFEREGDKISNEELYGTFSTFVSASKLSDASTNIRHFGQGLKRSLPTSMIDHGARKGKRFKSFKSVDDCRRDFEKTYSIDSSIWLGD